jgi:hypothetical protein
MFVPKEIEMSFSILAVKSKNGSRVLVADAYNLSYSGGRDQEGDQED